MGKSYIIEVEGSCGKFKQSGNPEIVPDDLIHCLRRYLTNAVVGHEEHPRKCPSPMAEGSISIKISYPKEKQ